MFLKICNLIILFFLFSNFNVDAAPSSNSTSKENNYKKIVDNIIEQIKSLQLSPSVLEDLVQKHYSENKKIVSLEGVLLRLAMENKISREEFLKYYVGNEINPKFETFLKENVTWKTFFKKYKKDFFYSSSIS